MKAINPFLLIVMLALAACSGGCVVNGHVHTATCGHYYSGGRWYYVRHHVHGPGCGHVFQGGIWIAAP